jgi:MFS family permease
MPTESRGRAMAFWSMGPLFGPIIGPIVGGYLVEGTNWRWVFWVLAIVVSLDPSRPFKSFVPSSDSCV